MQRTRTWLAHQWWLDGQPDRCPIALRAKSDPKAAHTGPYQRATDDDLRFRRDSYVYRQAADILGIGRDQIVWSHLTIVFA